MMPYRDSSGDELVCVRCGETTPLNPDAAARPPEGPFVCSACLVKRQWDAALTPRSGPLLQQWERVRRDDYRIPLVLFGLFIFVLGAVSKTGRSSGKGTSANPGGVAALPGGVAAHPGDVAALPPSSRPVSDAESRARAADPAGEAMTAAKERGDAAGREERQHAFSAYTLGLEGGGPALPKGLPTAWKLGPEPAVGPFDRTVWGTDEALTDVRVLVEKDRLRLGGKGQRAGEPVSCAGVVEPGQGDAAILVTGCADAAGTVKYAVRRLALPGLARVLASGVTGIVAGIPIALRGTYKTDPEDCKHANGELMVSASAIAEKGGPSVVAITATSSRLGTVLSGVNPADGRLCSAVVDEVAGVPRLRTTCNGRARYLLCKR